jgi:hypothetical protein
MTEGQVCYALVHRQFGAAHVNRPVAIARRLEKNTDISRAVAGRDGQFEIWEVVHQVVAAPFEYGMVTPVLWFVISQSLFFFDL